MLPSPVFHAFHDEHTVAVTCDCGASASFIHVDVANRPGLVIQKAIQGVYQADGVSPLQPFGAVHTVLSRGGNTQLFLDTLVVNSLDCEILGVCHFSRTTT